MEYCDYCGLEAKIRGFEIDHKDGKKIFCCEGCKAIYTLFGDAQVLKTKENNLSTIVNDVVLNNSWCMWTSIWHEIHVSS